MRVRQLADGPFVVSVGGDFRSMGRLMARLSRRVCAGFHGSGGLVLLAGTGTCWSAGVREGVEPCQGVCDHVGPGPVACESQVPTAGGRDELGGGGEQSKP